jgi:hypothetical protein
MFKKPALYVIQRGDDILPGVYDTHREASDAIQGLADGFEYSVGTVTPPPGVKLAAFKKTIEAKLSGRDPA